jgi:[acyl-carrier-protein] S-malonyltransferase
LPLSVSAPFHCALLAPAADEMAEALAEIDIAPPRPALVANVSAAATDRPSAIRDHLVAQVTATVRWRESVLYMKRNGVDTLVELGAGKVLGNLARRIDRDLVGVSLQTPDDIEAFLKTA